MQEVEHEELVNTIAKQETSMRLFQIFRPKCLLKCKCLL